MSENPTPTVPGFEPPVMRPQPGSAHMLRPRHAPADRVLPSEQVGAGERRASMPPPSRWPRVFPGL